MTAITPTNISQNVALYNKSGLAFLTNLLCIVSTANKKFRNFENEYGNLGQSTTFDLPPKFATASGLVWATQPYEQRVLTLTAGIARNVSFDVTNPETIFNIEKAGWDYLPQFKKSAMINLASKIESDIGLSFVSGMQNIDANGNPVGGLQTTSGPYRFYGNGISPINSYNQLASMITRFRNYGAVSENTYVILPDIMVPDVIGSGLNQFVPRRNDEDAMSWMLGEFGTPAVKYYQSNLLPLHTAGNVGVNQSTLTVVSVNDPTGQNVTQITFSGAATSDADAIFSGDLMSFNDGVSGKPNMRFLTFNGQAVSSSPVQIRATADAGSTGGGQVTVTITPALNWVGGGNQNLNNPITAGMQVTVLPSHRAGCVVGGDGFFVAMPKLPPQDPFYSSSMMDEDSGVSLRTSYGAFLGQGLNKYGVDAIYGATLVPEYAMRMILPLSQVG